MDKKRVINILLCIDDFTGNYTRHCAVTILSLLETNKNNTLKIYILSSCLSQENQKELKRIVNEYNQEIHFIIKKDIIPIDIKSILVNRRNLTYAAFYRMFFPLYIKNIDRILYLDCDVVINKDIWEIYSMDMGGKTIMGYHNGGVAMYDKKILGNKDYFNSGVLLFDAKKYQNYGIDINIIKAVNKKYGEYINDVDQDYLNIIFNDDVFIYSQTMNYMINRPFANRGYKEAHILHLIAKPYIKYSLTPKKLRKTYYSYLSQTKWFDFPKEKNKIFDFFVFIYYFIYEIINFILEKTVGLKGQAYFNRTLGKITDKFLSFFK